MSEEKIMENIIVKYCPYCKKELKLTWYENLVVPEDSGYACSYCGIFLDVEIGLYPGS